MQEAWITVQCPDCDDHWEADPASLPAPDADFDCDDCGTTRTTATFAQTKRDLEVLEAFH